MAFEDRKVDKSKFSWFRMQFIRIQIPIRYKINLSMDFITHLLDIIINLKGEKEDPDGRNNI